MKLLNNSSKIAIINRGESAYRFIRAIKEYNLANDCSLKSVAFYTDHEATSLFASEADESYAFSNFNNFKSLKGSEYLSYPLLIEAIHTTGCDAAWLGWGFVSEDAEFVRLLEENAIIILAPSSTVIDLVGDKISSKHLAESSNTPICPWSQGPVNNLQEAYDVANRIGYPLVVKASNAGGGRGIRFVYNKEEMASQYQSALDETMRVTGGNLMFVERLVERGRHLEVQALADYHGNIKTFGVRDCSVQRKNQKIIEQTPPQGLANDELKAIEDAAYRLLKKANYTSAGTVEFLYDLKHKEFYFMEVNARLQVEHPITELLFDIDLVAGQIDVAMGKSIEYYNTVASGCVMEVRLNAEDPEHNFRAAGGLVKRFRAAGGIGVRVDSAIADGSSIPPQFDSMIAKIIVKAPTHAMAVARLRRAVDETKITIDGGTTNRSFLLELLSLKEIQESQVSTRFVEEYLEHRPSNNQQLDIALCAAAVDVYMEYEADDEMKFNRQIMLAGFPRGISKGEGYDINLEYNHRGYKFKIRRLSQHLFALETKEVIFYFDYYFSHENRIVFDGKSYRVFISRLADNIRIELDNIVYLIQSDDGGQIKAVSPALLLRINVKEGDEVKIGDALFSLEAMKMEIPFLATSSGVIARILVKEGSQVNAGQTIIMLEKKVKQSSTSEAPTLFTTKSPAALNIHHEWCALFLGYDHLPLSTLEQLLGETLNSSMVITMAQTFIASEQPFSDEVMTMSGYTSGISYADYLVLYYRSSMTDESESPESFSKALKQVKNIYHFETNKNDWLIYRLFRSHKAIKNKESILSTAITRLSSSSHAEDYSLFSLLIKRLEILSPPLAIIASEKRFNLFDQALLSQLQGERLKKIKLIMELLENPHANEEVLMSRATNYGAISEPYLASLALNSNLIALKILAYRLYRGCKIEGFKQQGSVALLNYINHHGETKSAMVTVAPHLKEALTHLGSLSADRAIIFLYNPYSIDDLSSNVSTMKSLTIGLVGEEVVKYNNYIKEGHWLADTKRTFISPLAYRELRIYRLENFNSNFYSVSNDITIAHSTSKDYEKDQRFFVFINIESSHIELNSDHTLLRLIGFEEHIQEAISALRHYQATQKEMLHWNRMVISIHPRLYHALDQIEAYAKSLVERYISRSLGLVQISIYLRNRKGKVSELIVSNIGNSVMRINHRQAPIKPLQPLSSYDAKVLRTKSRHLNYPYELLKILTENNANTDETTFIEYDIDENNQLVCVKGRAYGLNKANIVFGLITSIHRGCNYLRVIILGDPSTDMGSLAEAECRRVNAALDLADQHKIPLEWLPVSSGARIDMDSGTENLDWTASTLRRIIDFTQGGGEINIIVDATNVGAQSYWNSEATMLMHCRGLLIMTTEGSMLLTGKKALDFSGSVSADTNLGIGGAKDIMSPNGEAQIEVKSIDEAYRVLMHHYQTSYALKGERPQAMVTTDSYNRNIADSPYIDELGQGFTTIGDIFSKELNGDKKKPFDIRSVMQAVIDKDYLPLERWSKMADAQTAVVWQSRIGGYTSAMIGIESKNLVRHGVAPFNGPQSYSGGTLYPSASKKIARAINSFSNRMPLVILANLSGFDGSPESLLKNQLEWGAEIGRAVVNFKGPILFVVIGRYHGGAYVVFSKKLNENIKTIAIEGSYASVIGGAPAAAVVFPALVVKECYADHKLKEQQEKLNKNEISRLDFDLFYQELYAEKQLEWAKRFDQRHSVERAKEVGSIDEIIHISQLRSSIIDFIRSN